VERQIGRQTDGKTDRQTDVRMGMLIDRQTYRCKDRMTARQTSRGTGGKTDRQAD
jgi:hypothetical protein